MKRSDSNLGNSSRERNYEIIPRDKSLQIWTHVTSQHAQPLCMTACLRKHWSVFRVLNFIKRRFQSTLRFYISNGSFIASGIDEHQVLSCSTYERQRLIRVWIVSSLKPWQPSVSKPKPMKLLVEKKQRPLFFFLPFFRWWINIVFQKGCESDLGWGFGGGWCCLGWGVLLCAFCLGYFYWHFVSNPAGFGFVSCGFGGPGTRGWKNSSRATIRWTSPQTFLDIFIYMGKFTNPIWLQNSKQYNRCCGFVQEIFLPRGASHGWTCGG